MDLFNIAELAQGAVLEQFNSEMRKLLENIQDPNTDAVKKRKMVISLTLEPTKNRDGATIEVITKLTLVPTNSVTTMIYMDKDNKGNIIAGELIKGTTPGQIMIDDEGEITEQKIFKVK